LPKGTLRSITQYPFPLFYQIRVQEPFYVQDGTRNDPLFKFCTNTVIITQRYKSTFVHKYWNM